MRKKHQARVAGFLLEETAPAGIEQIIGGSSDPQIGPAVMFGTGGVAVELVKDVSYWLRTTEQRRGFCYDAQRGKEQSTLDRVLGFDAG